MRDLNAHDEPPRRDYPRCPLCPHSYHGLRCGMRITRTGWGAVIVEEPCGCAGEWGGAA